MTIKKIFIWTTIHTAIKILSGMIMNKIIAVYLGPSGLALIGQFQNFVVIVSGLANGSIQTGIVKLTAEYKKDQKYLNKILQNSLLITLLLSFMVFLILFVFADAMSQRIMFSNEYTNIMYYLAFSIVFYSLNLYILSILNGLSEIKLLTFINITISIVMLLLVSVFTVVYKLNGSLIAIITVQSLVFFISYIMILRKYGNSFFHTTGIIENIDKVIIKKLFKFSLVTFFSGMMLSLAMIVIRYIIEDKMSLEYAGIWDGAWRMMMYFNMLFMLPFSINYLPKFASSGTFVDTKAYLLEALKFFIPLAILLAVGTFYFKDILIKILFTDEFLIITSMIGYMLIAEIIRLCALGISHVFLAREKIFTILQIELMFYVTLILLTHILIPTYGIMALCYAYLIASILFLSAYLYQIIILNRRNVFVEK